MHKENKVPVFPTVMKNSPLIITDSRKEPIKALEKAGYEVKEYSMDDIKLHHGTYNPNKEQSGGE